MATTYRLTDVTSDLSGGADFSNDLIRTSGPSPPTPEQPGDVSVSIGPVSTEISFAWTIADDPNNADWETGTITVEVEVTTASSAIDLLFTASRVNSSGAVQETSGFSNTETLSSTGSYNFTIPSKDWSAGAVGDRIRINYRFTNTSLHGNNTVAFEANTDLTEHVTQITFAAGDIVVTPSPATLVTATVDPTVVMPSLSITPAVRTLVAATIAPLVVLGSLSLTPAVDTLVTSVVDPTVIVSGEAGQKQIFVNGPGWRAVAQGTTLYNTVLSTRISSANFEGTETTFQLIGTPGTLRNLRIDLDTAVLAGSLTCTIRKNKSDTALEVVISSGTTGSDLTTDLTVAAGDQINMKFVSAAGTTSIRPRWSLEFEGDNDKEFNMSAGTSFLLPSSVSTQFNSLIHHDAWNTINTNRSQVCPLDGTVKAWYIELDTAPGTGETWTFRIVKNLVSEASSEIVISGTGLTGNITGLSIDIAPGDRLEMQATGSSGPPPQTRAQVGIAIQADTAGESWVGGWSVNLLTVIDTTEEYILFGSGGDAWASASGQHLQAIGGSYTLKNFRVRANQGPGGIDDHLYTFRIRKNDAAGNSVVTLIDTDAGGVDSSNTDSFTPGDNIGISHRYDLTGSGSPAAMIANWAAIQVVTAEENIVVTPAAATLVTGKVDPTVILGSVSITPAVLTLVTATVDPTVILGSLAITPAVRTLVTNKADPTVVLGSISLTPAVRTLVAAVVDPTVEVSGGDITVTPAVLTLVTATVNPTVVLGSVSITPAIRTLVTATVNPTVLTPTILTPAILTLVTSRVDPTVILGSLSITPATTTLVTATLDPTVVLGSISVTPAIRTLVTSTLDPTVILGSLSITPAVLTLRPSVVDPTVLEGGETIVVPATLTLVTATVGPTVLFGSTSATPAATTLVAATVNPTVLTPTIISPAPLTLVTGKVDPTVILGSISLTPATLTLVTSLVDPTVVLGSFSFTPAPRTLVTGKVDPSVIHGSLTITPAVSFLVTAGVDPGIPVTVIPSSLTLVTVVGQPKVINSGDILIEIFIVNEKITQPRHANEAILQPRHANEKITIY